MNFLDWISIFIELFVRTKAFLSHHPSFIFNSLLYERTLHLFKSKISLFIEILILFQFGQFTIFAKYSGYPFFHQPTFVLSR